MTTHLGPPMNAVVQPLHSLAARVSSALQFGGRKLDGLEMMKACLSSCARKRTLSTTTYNWRTADGTEINSDTFMKQLRHLKQLPLDEVHSIFNGIFETQFQHALDRHQQKTPKPERPPLVAAFDFHEQPVDVNMHSNSPLRKFVHQRPKPDKYGNKKGKQYVLRYITCSLVSPFHHVLGIYLITPLDAERAWYHLTYMAARFHREFGVVRYLMDREFYNLDVISWFESSEAEGIEYLMPVPETPGVKDALGEAELDLSVFKGTYLEYILDRPYTLKSTKGNTDLTLNMVAKRSFLEHQRKLQFEYDGRSAKVKPFDEDHILIAFATNITEPLSYKQIERIYVKRWGIENGYREAERFMPPTPTRSIHVRIFWFALSCMVENVWTVACWREKITIYQFQDVVLEYCDLREREIHELLELVRQGGRNFESLYQFALRKDAELARQGQFGASQRERRERLERLERVRRRR